MSSRSGTSVSALALGSITRSRHQYAYDEERDHPFCHVQEPDHDAIFECDDCALSAEVAEQFAPLAPNHWEMMSEGAFQHKTVWAARYREFGRWWVTTRAARVYRRELYQRHKDRHRIARKRQWAEQKKRKVVLECVVCHSSFESVAITAQHNERPRVCSKKCLGKFGGAMKRIKKTPELSLQESLAMCPKRDRSKVRRPKAGPVEFNGQTKPVAKWATEYGINATTVYARLKAGFSLEAALTKTVRKYTRREVAEAIAHTSYSHGRQCRGRTNE